LILLVDSTPAIDVLLAPSVIKVQFSLLVDKLTLRPFLIKNNPASSDEMGSSNVVSPLFCIKVPIMINLKCKDESDETIVIHFLNYSSILFSFRKTCSSGSRR
jgi:hypothetical protein